MGYHLFQNSHYRDTETRAGILEEGKQSSGQLAASAAADCGEKSPSHPFDKVHLITVNFNSPGPIDVPWI